MKALSTDRIRAVLDAKMLDWQAVGEKTRASWGGHNFVLAVEKTSLVVTAVREAGQLELEDVERWHRENFWPRLALREDEVLASVQVDYPAGVADRQLAAMVDMALAKIREAFDAA